MWFGSGVNQISVNPSELIVTANIRSMRSVVAKNFVGDGGLISNIYFSNVSIPPQLSADITGNLVGNSVTLYGNATASFFVGNGSLLTGVTATLPPTVTADLLGNVTGTKATLSGNATALNFVGNSVGNLTGVYASLTGNATAAYFLGNGSLLTGVTATLPSTVTADLLGNVTGAKATLSGNVSAAYFLGNGALLTGVTATLPSTVTADLLGNVTGAKATLTGNATAAYFLGNGSLLTGVTATLPSTVTADLVGNVTGKKATLSGNLTASFVNATSVVAANAVLAGGSTVANANGLFTGAIVNSGYVYADTFVAGDLGTTVGFWRKSDGLLTTSAATITGRLTVNGAGSEFTGSKYYLSNPPGTATWTSYNIDGNPISIVTSYGIYMQGGDLWKSSDGRKKFDVEEEDVGRCAEYVRASRLVTYSTKDSAGRSLGFIAQQVANVVDGSVNVIRGALPSVMRLSKVVSDRSFVLEDAHSVLSGGHVVGLRIVRRTGAEEDVDIESFEGDVVTIASETALTGDDIFVYGPVVDDFNTLDYQRMWAVAFGAVKHLLSERDAAVDRLAGIEERLGALERRGLWKKCTRAFGRVVYKPTKRLLTSLRR